MLRIVALLSMLACIGGCSPSHEDRLEQAALWVHANRALEAKYKVDAGAVGVGDTHVMIVVSKNGEGADVDGFIREAQNRPPPCELVNAAN